MKPEVRDLFRSMVDITERRMSEIEDAVAQIDHRTGGQSEQLARQAEQIAALEARFDKWYLAAVEGYSRKVPE